MAASPRGADPGPGIAGELALVGALGALLLGGALVWSAGQLGAWLAHGRWPQLPVSGGLAVALRLPGQLSHPARAWPPALRPQLGPAPLFWAVLAVEMVAVLGVAVAGLAWWRSFVARGGQRGRRPGMASAAELRGELSARTRRRRAEQVRPGLDRAR
jgi:hypothetical protein